MTPARRAWPAPPAIPAVSSRRRIQPQPDRGTGPLGVCPPSSAPQPHPGRSGKTLLRKPGRALPVRREWPHPGCLRVGAGRGRQLPTRGRLRFSDLKRAAPPATRCSSTRLRVETTPSSSPVGGCCRETKTNSSTSTTLAWAVVLLNLRLRPATGEACKGALPPTPAPQSSGTSSFSGPPNAKSKRREHKKRRKHKRHHQRSAKHNRGGSK